jgi:superoxide reductase
MKPNTVDASKEKHVPQVTNDNGKITVKVGSVEHPMTNEHYIEWIYVCTGLGGHRKALKPGDKPEATFFLSEGEEICEVYAYCNLHGLWSAGSCE